MHVTLRDNTDYRLRLWDADSIRHLIDTVPFDEFLKCRFFSSHEVHPFFYDTEPAKLDEYFRPKNPDEFIMAWAVQAAIMGAERGCQYMKDCIDYYNNKPFYNERGEIDLDELIIGKHITRIAVQKYGYRYVDEDMLLADNMMIKKSDVFVGNMIYYHKGHEYAIHLCNGSWHDDNKDCLWRLRNYSPKIFDMVSPFFTIYIKIINRLKR